MLAQFKNLLFVFREQADCVGAGHAGRALPILQQHASLQDRFDPAAPGQFAGLIGDHPLAQLEIELAALRGRASPRNGIGCRRGGFGGDRSSLRGRRRHTLPRPA